MQASHRILAARERQNPHQKAPNIAALPNVPTRLPIPPIASPCISAPLRLALCSPRPMFAEFMDALFAPLNHCIAWALLALRIWEPAARLPTAAFPPCSAAASAASPVVGMFRPNLAAP